MIRTTRHTAGRYLCRIVDMRTDNEQVFHWLTADFVDYRPEMRGDGGRQYGWAEMLGRQLADTHAKLVALVLVTRHSADCRSASNWAVRLNAVEYATSICTASTRPRPCVQLRLAVHCILVQSTNLRKNVLGMFSCLKTEKTSCYLRQLQMQ